MQLITTLFSSLGIHSFKAAKKRLDPVACLVEDVIVDIFCRLDLGALNCCLRVSKGWSKAADSDQIFYQVIYRTYAFNKEKWAKYHGDIGQELPLPADIRLKLKESHDALKKNHATFKKIPIEKVQIAPVQRLFSLIFMPATIDKKPFEAVMYGELVKKPKEESAHKTRYRCFLLSAKEAYGKASPAKSYWMLITKTVLEGSRYKKWEEQKALVATLPGFKIPKMLEAIVVNFTEYVATGVRLYNDDPVTNTCCQEHISDEMRLTVGYFTCRGLLVYYTAGIESESYAVSIAREL